MQYLNIYEYQTNMLAPHSMYDGEMKGWLHLFFCRGNASHNVQLSEMINGFAIYINWNSHSMGAEEHLYVYEITFNK